MSQENPDQGRGTTIPFDASKVPSGPRIMFTSCSTSQAGCAGVAYFGPFNQAASFRVWFGNGANGQSNFVIPAGQNHGIHVQSGDTYSSAWGSNGVPDNTPRNWINVG